jgi:hypothetical protein
MLTGELFTHSFTGRSTKELADLSETHYPGREVSNPVYLDWEYFRNPFGDAIITVAEDGGKPVSQYIVLPREYVINGNKVKGSLSVNTLTHQDYRGKNLLAKLALDTFNACRKSGIEFTIGFPNAVSFPVIRRKKIFSTGGFLPLLVKPIKPLKALLKLIRSEKKRSGLEIDFHFQLDEGQLAGGISLFDPEVDAAKYSVFLEQFNTRNVNTTNRSDVFLDWRYKKIPGRKYYFLKQEEGDRIQAIVIFRAREIFGIRCCVLVDLISINDFTNASKLVKAVNEIARRNKMDLLFTTVSSHSNEFRAVKASGYLSIPGFLLPQKLAFIYHCHDEKRRRDVSVFNNWFLTFGDYDIF